MAWDAQSMYKKLDRVRDLPTLPVVALEVNRLVDEPGTSIELLTKSIEKDQAIAGKLLKLVNSAFFGVRSKVTGIHEAVVLLGFNTVRNVVVSISLIKSFSGQKMAVDFDVTELWAHSVTVAILGRQISSRSGYMQADDCFVAGLLHDIGKLLLVQFFPDLTEEIVARSHRENLPWRQVEKSVSPLSHGKLGAYLTEKWRLPRGLSEVVSAHHQPDRPATDRALVMQIHAADLLANSLSAGGRPGSEIRQMSKDVARHLAEPLKNLSDWLPDVKLEIDQARRFFLEKP